MPWFAAAAPFISAGVGGMSAISSFSGAMNQKAGFDVAAKQAVELGDENAARTRAQYQRVAGEQVAGYGHAGVTMEGTPGEVVAETIFQGEQAAQFQKYLAAVKAAGLEGTGAAVAEMGKAQLIGGLGSSASAIGGSSWFKGLTAPGTTGTRVTYDASRMAGSRAE